MQSSEPAGTGSTPRGWRAGLNSCPVAATLHPQTKPPESSMRLALHPEAGTGLLEPPARDGGLPQGEPAP
eukprot:1629238-Prymnesium_polylepis.3